MAAGKADRRADAVGGAQRGQVAPLNEEAVHQLPPDLTMMVEEALALIDQPPPVRGAPVERADKTHVYSTWLPWREAVDRVARHLGYPPENARLRIDPHTAVL